MTDPRTRAGWTTLEIIVVLALTAVLGSIVMVTVRKMRLMANVGVSTVQIGGLVAANAAYAADHDGCFCPAMSADNLTRWHGGRATLDGEFDPERGYLSPYLGGSRRVLTCPLLGATTRDSFEKGAGGYGYNAEYVGGTPRDNFSGAELSEAPSLGGTVMFATTALATDRGLQEYPFTEPFRWVDRRGRLRTKLQPSTHFRADGKAIIAWGDGSVTLEKKNNVRGPNFYGGDNEVHGLGWFGPPDQNGYWNPTSPAVSTGRR